jgi:hypothetical protein
MRRRPLRILLRALLTAIVVAAAAVPYVMVARYWHARHLRVHWAAFATFSVWASLAAVAVCAAAAFLHRGAS